MKIKFCCHILAKLNALFPFCLLEIAIFKPREILACQNREIKYV